MEYFDKHLLEKCCDGCNPNLEQDEKRWDEMLSEYYEKFKNNSNRFPRKFVEYYLKHGFHDDILDNFEIVKRKTIDETHIDIITQFHNSSNRYQIRYFDVICFNTKMDFRDGYYEIGDYRYGELLVVDDIYLSHEFYFYNSSTFYIQFKKLQFQKLK